MTQGLDWGGGYNLNDRPSAGRRILIEGEFRDILWQLPFWAHGGDGLYHDYLVSMFASWQLWLGYFQGSARTPEDFRSNTFNQFKDKINQCIGDVFGKAAKKIPTQTLDNAPKLDVSLNGRDLAKRSSVSGKRRSILALPDPNNGPNGTVFIGSGNFNTAEYPLDVLQGAYIHEYGNILSYKHGGGDFYKFGDKAGIGQSFKDQDTGANFQKCVFPSSIKW